MRALLDRGPRRLRRRRAVLAVLVTALLVAGVGAELGALRAVGGSLGDADAYRTAHDWGRAVAVYRAVASQGGPLYLLARNRVDAAGAAAQRTVLDWAGDLAAAGRVDEALAATAQVTDPALQADRARETATIALDDARAQAAAGRFDVALRRVDVAAGSLPPADLAAEAARLRPGYALGAGRLLLARGDAAGAVTALDDLIAAAPGTADAAAAAALLPDAILAAGRQAIAAHDEDTALVDLNRLLGRFPGSPQARAAQALLAAPQPVTGTLVRRDGSPVIATVVRLGSHYRPVPGGYETQPPYYLSRTDDRGDFSFASVPLGSYVVEVRQPDGWTTILTPDGQPAYRVLVEALTPIDLAFVVVPG
jgi:tetratricopeptide (TPR) repeat protein